MRDADIGYGGQVHLQNVKLSLHPGDRIGLLGANGAGKSTLIKGIINELPLINGTYRAGEFMAIGYFAQHQVDELALDITPMQHLQRLKENATDQQIRNFLGSFGFNGDMALETCESFSGGELARLALARIAWLKPNLLILDEPTNHLDLDMRHALTLALQNYEGAILVVSHDRYLLSNTVDQFWLVHDGVLSEFDGDLEDYHQFIKRSQQEEDTSNDKEVTHNSAEAKKEKKRREAEIRKLMSPLKKSVDKLEAQVEKIQASLEAIEEKLADTELYEAKNKDSLQTILAEQASQTQQLQEVEESWMEKLEELEDMTEQLNNS